MSARIAANLALKKVQQYSNLEEYTYTYIPPLRSRLLYDPVRNLMQCRCGGLAGVVWCTGVPKVLHKSLSARKPTAPVLPRVHHGRLATSNSLFLLPLPLIVPALTLCETRICTEVSHNKKRHHPAVYTESSGDERPAGGSWSRVKDDKQHDHAGLR